MRWGKLPKWSRWLIYVVVILVLFGESPAFCGEQPGIRLVVDGTQVIPDVPPVIVEGRTLVPIRIVSEELGAAVKWDGETRTVTVVSAGTTVFLRIGDKKAVVGDSTVELDVPAVIINSRTMVPIRFVATALGATVDWDGDTRTVKVDRRPAPGPLRVASLEHEVTSEGVLVTIRGQGLKGYSAKTLAADGDAPDRLILDFQGLGLSLGSSIPIEAGPVARVRTGMLGTIPDIARVVFDLTEPVRFDVSVSSSGDVLRLLIKHKVTGLRVQATPDGPVVIVEATGPVSHRVLDLVDPPRLVVDIPGATLGQKATPSASFNGDLVKQVRMGQFQVDPDIVRVVADLTTRRGYDVEQTDEGLVIRFLSRIQDIRWDSWPSASHLTLEAGGPVKAEVTREGDRLFIVIPNATWGLKDQEFCVNEGVIGGIRVEERRMSPPSVHVEVELLENTGHRLVSSGQDGQVVLELSGAVQQVLKGKRVVVDPGHGGSDPGAISYSGEYEKHITLAISNYLKEYLQAAGAEVRMTRTGDQTVDVRERAVIANSYRADAFVSIHANSFTDASKRGIEVYHCSKLDDTICLAETVRDTLVSSLGLEDRGVRKAMFLVLMETNMPAVLVETGYLSNPQEERLLMDPAFQRRVAEAIGIALVRHFGGSPGF